jgi:creatinine amidohydrolase/Fe(II)-dependent formamide hydrolase-like protein
MVPFVQRLFESQGSSLDVEDQIEPSLVLSRGFSEVTENGILVDPRQFNETVGDEVLESVAKAYTEDVQSGRETFE